MNKLSNIGLFFIVSLLLTVVGCTPGVNKPGSEYMPDMGHSLAYEANVIDDYSLNTWDEESVVKYEKLANPRSSVKNTIPRGYMNTSPSTYGGIHYPLNGYYPFHYGDSEEERTRAAAEIKKNPFPITAENLAHGKEVYEITCAICHGKKADGNGYLVRDDGAYPSQPANLISDKFSNVSNGHIYYTIMYGKNVMQSQADKLSYKERWQVIHYLRSLQAKAHNKVYNENENTFDTYGIPVTSLNKEVEKDVVGEDGKMDLHSKEHKEH